MVKLTKAELARLTTIDELGYLEIDTNYVLGELVAKFGSDAVLFVEEYYDYSSSEVTLRIRRIREETDDEYKSRIDGIRETKRVDAERKQKQKQAQIEKDRKIFDALRTKHNW